MRGASEKRAVPERIFMQHKRPTAERTRQGRGGGHGTRGQGRSGAEGHGDGGTTPQKMLITRHPGTVCACSSSLQTPPHQNRTAVFPPRETPAISTSQMQPGPPRRLPFLSNIPPRCPSSSPALLSSPLVCCLGIRRQSHLWSRAGQGGRSKVADTHLPPGVLTVRVTLPVVL